MKLFVSRQLEWPDGDNVVEIAVGGLDYANPGMFAPLWPELGECKEFTDPREAVESAIAIRDVWKKELVTRAGSPPDIEIPISFGSTGGCTLPLTRYEDEELKKKADDLYEKLPKCAQCSELLGKETYTHDLNFMEENFCSESCAEKSYNYLYLQDLHARANEIFQDASLSWEEKYDQIFSKDISVKIFNLIRLDYADPDTSYQEDVEAFMKAFNYKMEGK